jgi:hypothetical protein
VVFALPQSQTNENSFLISRIKMNLELSEIISHLKKNIQTQTSKCLMVKTKTLLLATMKIPSG